MSISWTGKVKSIKTPINIPFVKSVQAPLSTQKIKSTIPNNWQSKQKNTER